MIRALENLSTRLTQSRTLTATSVQCTGGPRKQRRHSHARVHTHNQNTIRILTHIHISLTVSSPDDTRSYRARRRRLERRRVAPDGQCERSTSLRTKKLMCALVHVLAVPATPRDA